jgi:excisionase family DNA binding protein
MSTKGTPVAMTGVSMLAPRLLDLEGAAHYLAVSVWTIRDLLDAGRLPRVRLPGAGARDLRRVLLDREDLDRLVREAKDSAP